MWMLYGKDIQEWVKKMAAIFPSLVLGSLDFQM